MTLSKLARLANVSVSVVSKAFSGKGGISDAMREHVFAVAKENGCFHKFYHARYDKPVIAVIIPEAISKYYIDYIEILKADLEESGYTMLLSISNFDPALTEDLIRYYTSHSKVDGLIIVDGEYSVGENADTDTAIVSITADPSIAVANSSVVLSIRDGLTQALKSLYEDGHRRIAFVGEPLTSDKRQAFTDTARSIGLSLPDSYVYTSYHRFAEAGRDGADYLLSLDEAPTAIIGAYGYITEGIVSAISDRAIKIPEEISVISMDSHPIITHNSIPVPHLSSGIEELCKRAIDILKEKLSPSLSEKSKKTHIKVESDFIDN